MNSEVIWASGLLEGEGCFGWYGRWGGYPLVQMCSVDKDVIERLDSIFDGTMGFSHVTTNGKDVWTWRAGSIRAITCMELVLPYMGERRSNKINECLSKWCELEEIRQEKIRLREIQCTKGHSYAIFGYRKNGKYKRCKECIRLRELSK